MRIYGPILTAVLALAWLSSPAWAQDAPAGRPARRGKPAQEMNEKARPSPAAGENREWDRNDQRQNPQARKAAPAERNGEGAHAGGPWCGQCPHCPFAPRLERGLEDRLQRLDAPLPRGPRPDGPAWMRRMATPPARPGWGMAPAGRIRGAGRMAPAQRGPTPDAWGMAPAGRIRGAGRMAPAQHGPTPDAWGMAPGARRGQGPQPWGLAPADRMRGAGRMAPAQRGPTPDAWGMAPGARRSQGPQAGNRRRAWQQPLPPEAPQSPDRRAETEWQRPLPPPSGPAPQPGWTPGPHRPDGPGPMGPEPMGFAPGAGPHRRWQNPATSEPPQPLPPRHEESL